MKCCVKPPPPSLFRAKVEFVFRDGSHPQVPVGCYFGFRNACSGSWGFVEGGYFWVSQGFEEVREVFGFQFIAGTASSLKAGLHLAGEVAKGSDGL